MNKLNRTEKLQLLKAIAAGTKPIAALRVRQTFVARPLKDVPDWVEIDNRKYSPKQYDRFLANLPEESVVLRFVKVRKDDFFLRGLVNV